MGLSCVYTDLDGTLLGAGASLFRDAEGGFSLAQARGLEACQRAGVEVVIMSGRREPQVHEAARLMGQTSYIYEAGCAFAIDGETTLLTGEMAPERGRHDLRADRGRAASPSGSSSTSKGGWSTTRPGTPAASSPTSSAARSTSTRPTRCSGEHGDDDLRLLDNGAIGRPMPTVEGRTHAYHLVPRQVSKAAAVAAHARARGYDPADCIAVGDSVEDLEVAAAVGRFFVVANGPERDPGLRAALASWDNATVTEGSMGDGFYEAIVSTLVERR